ncbi:MAG TPA: hypothetical protein VGH95_00560 [Candidatus Aquirickettsiella sp.]|jgi:hypothetical protein
MLPILPAQNITQDYSAYIINLSTIHGLAPISMVLDNFYLCTSYQYKEFKKVHPA